MKLLLTCLLLGSVVFPSSTFAQELYVWALPQELNEANTKIQFDVDSTWHVVTGKIEKVSGELKLRDEANPLSVDAEFRIPVKSIKTDWEMRDDSLYEHMAEEDYKEIVVKIKGVEGDCPLGQLIHKTCKVKLLTSLSIRDITKDISLDATIDKKADSFVISGRTKLKWAEYNVEDPSIFMAKVDPVVTISYSVILPSEKLEKEEASLPEEVEQP